MFPFARVPVWVPIFDPQRYFQLGPHPFADQGRLQQIAEGASTRNVI